MNILDIKMQDNDAGAATIGDYLVALTRRLWIEEEGFSSKRPFGNSGWKWEVYISLAVAGIIESKYDDDGNIEISISARQIADEIILKVLS